MKLIIFDLDQTIVEMFKFHNKATEETFQALFDEDMHAKLLESGKFRFSQKALQAALLINLYRDQPLFQLPFQLLTVLGDLDEVLTTWRYRHSLLALRMIGTKIGSGGTSGHQYLLSTVESQKIFSDIFELSTFLIPRSALPPLPDEIRKQLSFSYSL